MKKLSVALLFLGMVASGNANAWFFFFLPTGAIADAITGSKGDICIKEGSKEGDVSTSEAGNTMKIISTSGTSSRCQNPLLPIRAEVEFTMTSTSKAGIELTDDFEAKPLLDLQRYNGQVLLAKSKTIPDKGVLVSFIKRAPTSDIKNVVNNVSNRKLMYLKEAKSGELENLTINGMRAARFETTGYLPGLAKIEMTYVSTVLEDRDEIVLVDAWCKTDLYNANPEIKIELTNIAQNIKGLSGEVPVTAVYSKEKKAVDIKSNAAKPISEVTIKQSTTTTSQSSESSRKLIELKGLLDQGIITTKDYESKKQEILRSM